jgi:hypothetical protein
MPVSPFSHWGVHLWDWVRSEIPEIWRAWIPGACWFHSGGLERNGEAGRLIDCFEFSGDLLNLAAHYEINRGGLDGPETTLTPFGDSHLFDEIHFKLCRGLQLVNVGLQEALEAITRFVCEDQAVGGASVTRRVLRTDEFTLDRAGSATLGAIGRAKGDKGQ